MATTRFGPFGYGVEPEGSFASKTAYTAPVSDITPYSTTWRPDVAARINDHESRIAAIEASLGI